MIKTLLVLACAVVMNAQVPKIKAAVNSASSLYILAPHTLATVYGESLSAGVAQAAGLPLPLLLNSTEVLLCNRDRSLGCTSMQLIYVSPGQINFLLNISSKQAGIWELKVRNRAVSSDAVLVIVDPEAPGVFQIGYDCPIDPTELNIPCGLNPVQTNKYQVVRGAITDLAGTVVTAANPVRMDRYYTLWLTGLGHPEVIGDLRPQGGFGLQFYTGTVGKDQPHYNWAEVSYVGPSSQFPGLYQINFKLGSSILSSANGHEVSVVAVGGGAMTVDPANQRTALSNPVSVPIRF